ncbi:MAG: terminase large subunit [Deltaproteobacteria bacterium]|nr:MAG: terminase large subunit [Deltaproteobacteria bacterium]
MAHAGALTLDLSCRDWEERIRGRRSLVPAAAHGINPAETDRAIKIFDKLRLPDVPGTPALAEAGGAWFREIVGVLLGSIDTDTGNRVVRELFLLAAKKSSKTSYGAALMMTALIMNDRPRAEFLLVAPTQAVAELAFSQAAGMTQIDSTGFLQRWMQVQDHVKCITNRRTKAQLKIKTFETSVLTGVKPAGVLIDELHEISRNAKAARIIGQIRGGLLPIPEAFLAFITTQSDEPPAGAFRAELNMARAIRDGRAGDAGAAMLPVLYEFPSDIVRDRRWQDSAYWPMVTPNLGKSITIERLVADYQTASYKGEDEIRRWASQHLNIEIGVGLKSDGWPGAEFWEAAEDSALTLEKILIRSEVVVVGIDGGGLDDLFGLAVVGRDRETSDWLSWSHAWCHRSVLERRKSIAARLLQAQVAGELTIVEHAAEDIEEIVALIADIDGRHLLACVAVDPAGLGELVEALRAIDVTQDGDRVMGAPQGYAMMNAIKTAERKTENGSLKHAPNALMDWCVGNVKIEPTATAIRATKQNAGDAKIDPWMALMDAVTMMVRDPKPHGYIDIEALIA